MLQALFCYSVVPSVLSLQTQEEPKTRYHQSTHTTVKEQMRLYIIVTITNSFPCAHYLLFASVSSILCIPVGAKSVVAFLEHKILRKTAFEVFASLRVTRNTTTTIEQFKGSVGSRVHHIRSANSSHHARIPNPTNHTTVTTVRGQQNTL